MQYKIQKKKNWTKLVFFHRIIHNEVLLWKLEINVSSVVDVATKVVYRGKSLNELELLHFQKQMRMMT